jgi:hypothetical protein
MEGLVSTIPHLGPILIPIIFVIFYYAIVGLHLFMGVTEIRCFKTPEPEHGVWELEEEIKNGCGSWPCPHGYIGFIYIYI